MDRIRARFRGVNAETVFLSHYEPPDGSQSGRRRRVVFEKVVGNLLLWRAVFTECLAVFLFVFLGTGSSVAWPGANAPSNLHISLSFGLVIGSLVHCFGEVSGAHLNPAVTLPLVVYRELSVVRGLLYIGAQCLGSYLGAALLRAATPADPRYNATLGCTLLGEHISVGQGFAVELIVSLQLIFTVFMTTDPQRKDDRISPALAIGVSVAVGLLIAVPFTGASMNPARSFGPALSAGNWSNHWVYWVAPLLAGLIASTVYRRLFAPGTLTQKQTQANQRQVQRVEEESDTGSTLENTLGAADERVALTSPAVALNNNNILSGSHIITDV
ncbi:aquaporin AQPAe.a-like [Acanthaster planci]|uniref:Aquaporin AQPAe.a-like n=1 Tax=Acanthaster planci TaxID=133434 RepID=A0A8B7YW49_ACAPL|nr:aquaporin AQPAe.a-like [Acanthaster planci]